MVYFGFESIPDTRTAGKIKEFSLKNIMSTSERKFDGGEITERWESVRHRMCSFFDLVSLKKPDSLRMYLDILESTSRLLHDKFPETSSPEDLCHDSHDRPINRVTKRKLDAEDTQKSAAGSSQPSPPKKRALKHIHNHRIHRFRPEVSNLGEGESTAREIGTTGHTISTVAKRRHDSMPLISVFGKSNDSRWTKIASLFARERQYPAGMAHIMAMRIQRVFDTKGCIAFRNMLVAYRLHGGRPMTTDGYPYSIYSTEISRMLSPLQRAGNEFTQSYQLVKVYCMHFACLYAGYNGNTLGQYYSRCDALKLHTSGSSIRTLPDRMTCHLLGWNEDRNQFTPESERRLRYYREPQSQLLLATKAHIIKVIIQVRSPNSSADEKAALRRKIHSKLKYETDRGSKIEIWANTFSDMVLAIMEPGSPPVRMNVANTSKMASLVDQHFPSFKLALRSNLGIVAHIQQNLPAAQLPRHPVEELFPQLALQQHQTERTQCHVRRLVFEDVMWPTQERPIGSRESPIVVIDLEEREEKTDEQAEGSESASRDSVSALGSSIKVGLEEEGGVSL